MIDQTTAIFCIVDDLLKELHWQEDRRRQTSDAEVITTALAAACFFGGNQAKARAALHQAGLIPAMLGPSRFCRRLHQVGTLIEQVFGAWVLPSRQPAFRRAIWWTAFRWP